MAGMGQKRGYRNVARVTGKVGKAGEVKVEPIDELPFLLEPGMEVHLTPPRLTGLRSAAVERVSEMGEGWAVKFAGCDDSTAAFELVGRLCLVAIDDLPELEPELDPGQLLGLAVVDEELGALGEVVDVLVNPEQLTLVVAAAGDGDAGAREVLIPFVDEFVRDIDDESLVVAIPPALLDLNA